MPPAVFGHMWETIKQGKPWMGVVKNRAKNGDYYWVSAYVTAMYERPHQWLRVRRSVPTREQIRRAERCARCAPVARRCRGPRAWGMAGPRLAADRRRPVGGGYLWLPPMRRWGADGQPAGGLVPGRAPAEPGHPPHPG
jgi:aerotaxis receptor